MSRVSAQAHEVDDLALAVGAGHRRGRGVALEVEPPVEEGVEHAGRPQAPPVGVDDRLGRRLGGQRAVAEQLEEEPALLWASPTGSAALVVVEELGGRRSLGVVALHEERDVVAAFGVGEGRWIRSRLPPLMLVDEGGRPCAP